MTTLNMDPSDHNARDSVVSQAKILGEICDEKSVAVQAGGHKGAAPIELVKNGFGLVYTYEPEINNFRELVALSGDSIIPQFGLLHCKRGLAGIEQKSKRNSGDYRMVEDGSIPVHKIDDLDLADCGLIWLDTQGTEYEIILGALETIQRCKPVIGFEYCPDKCPQSSDVGSFLESIGYEFFSEYRLDRFYKCAH